MTTEEKIKEFILSAALEVENYELISNKLQVERGQLTLWEKEHNDRFKETANIRRLYLRKQISTISLRYFYQWYKSQHRACHYCKITEEQIVSLLDAGLIKTKRITTRGRRVEIERKQSEETYDNIENLVLCCYWCNNAKTDEFSEDEFMEIGNAFRNIWTNRLASISLL